MLIRYKKNLEKISMGLLSFMPSEKDVKKLQQTIKMYEMEDNWQLFLWKDEDIIGIIGVLLNGDRAELQHLSVTPSHRHQGVGCKMLEELKKMIPETCEVIPNGNTLEFVEKCKTENL